MLCVIWYHLYNLENVENTHGGVLLLEKLPFSVSSFTKSITPPWVFFTYFKMYKWYQIVQASWSDAYLSWLLFPNDGGKDGGRKLSIKEDVI